MEGTYWVAITLPPGDFDQSQSLTPSYTHGSLEGQAIASKRIASYYLDLHRKPGFAVSKSPTPNQAIDVGVPEQQFISLVTALTPLSRPLYLCELDRYCAEQRPACERSSFATQVHTLCMLWTF